MIMMWKMYSPKSKTNKNKPHVLDAEDAIAFSFGQSKWTLGFKAKYTRRIPQINK